MPHLNIPLTDEQHAQLRRWAFDSRRSLAKEIIYRVFANGLAEAVRPDTDDRLGGVSQGSGEGGTKLPEPAASASPDDHFKPDFK